MQQDNARNTIIFIVCAVAIFILYDLFVLRPNMERRQAEAQRARAAQQDAAIPGAASPAAAPGTVFVPRAQAAADDVRVPVDTPWLRGTINLTGARLDDLWLKRYRETLDRSSPNVELFRPEGARHAYFAEFGWSGQNLPNLPTASTRWTLAQGRVLTPATPIVLAYDNGAGLTFRRTIAVDERYMFTVTDQVVNRGTGAVTLVPYGSIQRHGLPAGLGRTQILHEGGIGALGTDKAELVQTKYGAWRKRDEPLIKNSEGGWVGITDKYWLSSLVPDQQARGRGVFRVTDTGPMNIYEARYVGGTHNVAPNTQLSTTTRLFAGAKSVEVLDSYADRFEIPRFHDAVDWGNFWFLTKPIFYLLHWFQGLVGNFGIAILLLTVVVRALFFPLANKSYASFAKLRKLQPKMEELKKKYGKDPQKQQQELLALYQKEGANPIAGCLPILLQIPVFYALYKVLFVTLEMRHTPFFGWIRDLSARDPTTFWNLFGAIPWDPATLPLVGGFLGGPLHIGVWPLLYGFTMWLTQSMNPPAPDPVQRKIFQFFPVIFTFVMAPFAVGLVIYWTWSNVLSIIQQYVIMRRYKVDNPIDDIIARVRGRPVPPRG
ncbi:MAG TPA: membrane protein insertase YidC [Caulobacteraceae bacterium]